MAGGASPFIACLCLLSLSAISSARDTFHFLGVDETNHVSNSDPAANTILLPTDKPDSKSESETMIQWEPQTKTSDPSISEPNSETLESLEEPTRSSIKFDSDHVPLTLIRFRPINRHDIPRRPLPFTFRLGGHRCRHSHNWKPWDPRLPRREISYGNDMILSKFEDSGVVRQIPPRFLGKPRFSQEPVMERIEEMGRPHPHHHHHHHEDHNEGALMKGIRKFLNHF